jgi:hypothetical protein
MIRFQENKTQLTPDFEAIKISLASPEKRLPNRRQLITARSNRSATGFSAREFSDPWRTGNVFAESING